MDRRIGVMRVEGGTTDVVVGPYRVGIDRASPVEDGRGEGLDRVEREEDRHGLRSWRDGPRWRIEWVNHRAHIVPQLLAVGHPLGPLLSRERHVWQLRVVANLQLRVTGPA